MYSVNKRTCFFVLACSLVAACDDSSSSSPPSGNTPEYVSQSPGSSSNSYGGTVAVDGAGSTKGGSNGAVPVLAPSTPGAEVPGGRVADVQEADVYKVLGNKLFLLNTYKGFLIYDISNTKAPVRLGRLPVYGYPVEMFVENNTVYALLSDALYLSKVEGQLKFQRRNSSQIVTIDISDPANPKLLQAQDLPGQLREGVSRKIENTIYVVSYQPSGYWFWGWGPQTVSAPNEQAWVYSFDATTPANLKQVGKLKIFEGGSTNTYDSTTGESHSRNSNGVALSATSNAIMVVQNWYSYDSVPPKTSGGTGGTGGSSGVDYSGCWSYKNDQDSVVSIVDVSDPSGKIQVAATFNTSGSLSDQFKQTYVYDAQAKTGTYLGIFDRRQWKGDACNYSQETQNTIEAWNLNGDGTATKLSALDFGKPNEMVRGSSFDVDRKVAFAITAQNTDPMYAISFADRSNLKVLSAIDGLSGDMDLFRSVQGGQYLLAVGRDTGAACKSYVPGDGSGKDGSSWNNQIAVSLIDVRNLSNIRLVQRKCLDIANAGWVGSDVTWNLDQAHKMIGLESDGTTNVLTVPVSYSVQDDSNDGWYWYRYETAVGILSWDLTQYRDTLPAEQQNVITTHGHFVHPNGEVKRTVLYQQASGQREMLNISDSHLSFANIQSLDAPTLDSVVEIAAADQAVYHFGNYVVEQVALPSNDYRQTAFEFRVKATGVDLEGALVLARFTVGQVQQVIRHGNQLVMLQYLEKHDDKGNVTYNNQAQVFDLANPLAPKSVGAVALPDDVSPYGSYYRYYCGPMGYGGGYYFGYTQGMAVIEEGIAFLIQSMDYRLKGSSTNEYETVYKQNLAFIDLRDPTHPQASEIALSLPGAAGNLAESASVVADSMASNGFYISYRVQIGQTVDDTTKATLYSYANYAQRWQRKNGAWSSESAINIPGPLVRTWGNASAQRLFLTRDDVYSSKAIEGGGWQWIDTVTLNLLAAVTANGTTRAALLDARAFADMTPKSLVFDGDRVYMVLSNMPYYWGYGGGLVDGPVGAVSTGGAVKGGSGAADTGEGTPTAVDTSDRLTIIDTSQGKLASTYEQSTLLTNVDLMAAQQNKLFVNLQGDGILVVDVTNAAAPKATSFYRTLGWASGIELAGTSAYVPADSYGVYRLDLSGAGNL
jgi:hypothetical protein